MPHYEIHAFSTYVRYGLFFDPPPCAFIICSMWYPLLVPSYRLTENFIRFTLCSLQDNNTRLHKTNMLPKTGKKIVQVRTHTGETSPFRRVTLDGNSGNEPVSLLKLSPWWPNDVMYQFTFLKPSTVRTKQCGAIANLS